MSEVGSSRRGLGVMLFIGGVLVIGSLSIAWTREFFHPRHKLRAYFGEIEGLTASAPVRMDGFQIGRVAGFRLVTRDSGKARSDGKNIEVELRIDPAYAQEIRTDSRAILLTEGLLGGRYVRITRGFAGPPLPPDGELETQAEMGIRDLIEQWATVVKCLAAQGAQGAQPKESTQKEKVSTK